MKPGYDYFDRIVQYRAWNPEFYKIVQEKYPEQYKGVAYTKAFYDWCNNFKATWPSLITEPESEEIKVEEQKFKAVLGCAEVMLPEMDASNKARVFAWMQDSFNESKKLFPHPLDLDFDALEEHLTKREEQGAALAEAGAADDPDEKLPKPPAPRADSDVVRQLPRRKRDHQ